MPESAKPRVLAIDDSKMSLALVSKYLEEGGYDVVTAKDGAEGLRILQEHGIQLVITDWEMPKMGGLDLCRAIRSSEGVGFVFVILVTAHSNKARLLEAFDAGADDYLPKPFDQQELLARLRAGQRVVQLENYIADRALALHKANAELALLNEKLERMATTDELTGLLNRRQGLVELRRQWEMAQRYGGSTACIMLDIDHFKKFNDQHGHAAGDTVLKEIAAVLMSHARNTDIVCRLGGEEFVILCPGADAAGAQVCAERHRVAIENHVVRFQGKELRVTSSLGVAQRTEQMAEPEDILKAADEALYVAKAAGRNRVELAQPSATPVPL